LARLGCTQAAASDGVEVIASIADPNALANTFRGIPNFVFTAFLWNKTASAADAVPVAARNACEIAGGW